MWGPAIGAGLGLLGTMATNQASAAQSQTQMDFQRQMSNSAYQRQRDDMLAAGLNPILGIKQGGASTPPGAMAQMQNPAQAMAGTGQAVANVTLTAANESLAKANEALQTAKIPGAEAESIIQSAKKDVLESIDETTRKNANGIYDNVLSKLEYVKQDLTEKGQALGIIDEPKTFYGGGPSGIYDMAEEYEQNAADKKAYKKQKRGRRQWLNK